MTDPENNFSRLNRKKGRKRSDKILNVLIVAVILAIIITSTIIFSGGNDEADEKEPLTSEEVNDETSDDDADEVADDNAEEGSSTEEDLSTDLTVDDLDEASNEDIEKEENKESGIVTYLYSDDEVIERSIINPSWEPIPTQQTGEHVSQYVKSSVDWKEKQEAIAYATGLSIDDTITWKIKNGGSPQKSIGIVSSKDKVEKYRVYIEWIDNEGWKPVKLDILKTLDFNY